MGFAFEILEIFYFNEIWDDIQRTHPRINGLMSCVHGGDNATLGTHSNQMFGEQKGLKELQEFKQQSPHATL